MPTHDTYSLYLIIVRDRNGLGYMIPDSRFPTPCLIPYHDHYIQSFTDDFFTAPIPYLLPLVPLFPIPCSLHSLVFRSYSLFSWSCKIGDSRLLYYEVDSWPAEASRPENRLAS